MSSLPNTSDGVFISGGNTTTVGGTTAAQANVIAFNGARGVAVASGTANRITLNSVRGNGSLGIDLGTVGVTANDNNDPDSGANSLQNYPVLASATVDAGVTTVGGQLNSVISRPYTIDFYNAASCDPSGFGEGDTHIGSTSVTTLTNTVGFTVSLPAQAAKSYIPATATSSDGTSELSASSSSSPGPRRSCGPVRLAPTGRSRQLEPERHPSGVSFVRIPVTTIQPTVTGTSTVNDLIVDLGVSVTQLSGVMLTVNRDATINGTLVQNPGSVLVAGRDLFRAARNRRDRLASKQRRPAERRREQAARHDQQLRGRGDGDDDDCWFDQHREQHRHHRHAHRRSEHDRRPGRSEDAR